MKTAVLPDFMRRTARAPKRASIATLLGNTDGGILVDVFAGFGGGSIASERAHGRPVNVAINHWPKAIEFHKRNHPEPTLHFTADVREIDPLAATGGKPVAHAHFSPDCRHFSSAKGGTPVSDGVRALPWVVLHWAKMVRPTLITMENVKEFLTWGPTVPAVKHGALEYWPSGEMKRIPDKKRQGQIFRTWLGRFKAMGYEVDWKVLDAAHYGAPTHRKRLFLVARNDGQAVAWPAPTHGSAKERAKNPKLLAYRTAAECIDFTRPCPSIFMSRAESRDFQKTTGIRCNRPLAKKTQWRIANGVKRFVIEAVEPFLVRCAHGDGAGASQRWGRGAHPTSEPLPTVTGSKDFAMVASTLAKYYSSGDGKDGQECSEPLDTVTTKPRFGLIGSHLTQVQHGGMEPRGRSVEMPLNVITGKHGYGLVASHLVKFRGDSLGTSASAPIPTITAGQGAVRDAGAAHALGLSSAVLVEVQNAGNATGAREVTRPGPTIMAHPKGGGWALAGMTIVRAFHGEKPADSPNEPLRVITSQSNKFNLCAAHLTHFHDSKGGEVRASDVREPIPTQDTSNRFGTVAAFLAKLRGSGGWKPCDVPLDVVCAGAPTFAAVSAFITRFYGTATGQDILKPLLTVTANAGGGHMGAVHAFLSEGVDAAALAGFWRVYAFLVEHLGQDAPLPMLQVDGHLYLIVDIGLRMLEPRELLNAQFTPELAADYVLPTNKSLAVKLIGNSVSPPVLEAVIRAQGLDCRKRRAA